VWGRIVDIRAVKGVRQAAGYALKEAMQVTGYAMKGAEGLESHLELNGGRGVHMTRRYLRGWTSDQVSEALQQQNHRESYTWVLVRQGVELSEVGLTSPLLAAGIPPEMVRS
jgi:hypothetical protein